MTTASSTGLKIIGNDASVHRISTCGSQSQTLQRDSSTSPNSDSMFSRVLSLTYCTPRETPKRVQRTMYRQDDRQEI